MKNSKATLRAPVPDKVYDEATLLLTTTSEFSPKINFLAAVTKSLSPSIGKYSLSKALSLTISASTYLTILNGYGFSLSSL